MGGNVKKIKISENERLDLIYSEDRFTCLPVVKRLVWYEKLKFPTTFYFPIIEYNYYFNYPSTRSLINKFYKCKQKETTEVGFHNRFKIFDLKEIQNIIYVEENYYSFTSHESRVFSRLIDRLITENNASYLYRNI